MKGRILTYTKQMIPIEPFKQIYGIAVVELENGEKIVCRVDKKYFSVLRTGLTGTVEKTWSVFGEYYSFEPEEKPVIKKVALITGGARGIGAAIALELAEHGYDVAIADISFDKEAEETLNQLKSKGVDAIFVEMNVTEPNSVEKGVKEVVNKLGRIDVLVNNAGITRDQYLQRITPELWDLVLNVNLKGAYLCSRAVVPIMIDNGGGVIVNITSIVGIVGNIGQANYAASKAGMIGLTYTLAKELAPYGIRVVAVAPGFTRTRMALAVPPNILRDYIRRIPIPRLVEPAEVAKLVYHLIENEALNGIVVPIDLGTVISTPKA